MKTLVLACMLMTTQAVSASPPAERTAVSLHLVGDDGLTQKLTSGLQNELQNNAALRPAVQADKNAVFIESDSNVDWDELSGRTVVIYTVYVFRGERRGAPHTGVCYENGISKCIHAITRLARIEAARP